MVNRSRGKGTSTETLVVGYLRENGWPWAERRALSGSLDKGDVAGCPGLAIEVKYGRTLKIGPWLVETRIEQLNAKADHGILVVKPRGIGERNVGRFYAVMWADDFELLMTKVPNPNLFVINGPPLPYTADSLALVVHAGTNDQALGPREVFAAVFKPPGTKDKPEKWYRVMTLHHMTRLLRAAGYGDPEPHELAAS